jgi:hypothetical protein
MRSPISLSMFGGFFKKPFLIPPEFFYRDFYPGMLTLPNIQRAIAAGRFVHIVVSRFILKYCTIIL